MKSIPSLQKPTCWERTKTKRLKMQKNNRKKALNFGYFYFFLSIYIFIQASFFPQQPARFLIYSYAPKIDNTSIIFLPYDHVRYLNIVVYCGLAISGTFFLKSLNIFFQRILKKSEMINRIIETAITLLIFTLVFLCTVKVYHLSKGNEAGLFEISDESLVTLIVLLICVSLNFFRKAKKNKNPTSHQKAEARISKDK